MLAVGGSTCVGFVCVPNRYLPRNFSAESFEFFSRDILCPFVFAGVLLGESNGDRLGGMECMGGTLPGGGFIGTVVGRGGVGGAWGWG